MIPWKDVSSQKIDEWLRTFARAKGTCKDFIIASSFPAVSALMGNTVAQIFDGFEELANVYILALGGPSSGKTQSHKSCVIEPILHNLQTKSGAKLLLELRRNVKRPVQFLLQKQKCSSQLCL